MPDGSIPSKCLAGGIGCGIAGFLTNPCDVVKIRNQQSPHARHRTFRSAAGSILREEGPRGFCKGAQASVLRECTYSSLRMGLYEPVKVRYSRALEGGRDGDGDGTSSSSSPWVKWLAAFTTGAIGSAIFNPVDVVKVRFQAATGAPPYPSLPRAFQSIYAEKGLRGLYIGTSVTVTRAAFLTSAELGSYDVIKNDVLVKSFGFDGEANLVHFWASFAASLIATTVANPADVVKTRVMNDPHGIVGGPTAHFVHILKTDGPVGFLKGWTASYLRIGPHTVISLVLIEKVRQLIGIPSF
ncbi:hypothetical protein ACHAWF_002979 [Thalassiosira exigua]